MNHPASCCCERCLRDIEAGLDGNQPFYIPALLAEIRRLRAAPPALLLGRARQRAASLRRYGGAENNTAQLLDELRGALEAR